MICIWFCFCLFVCYLVFGCFVLGCYSLLCLVVGLRAVIWVLWLVWVWWFGVFSGLICSFYLFAVFRLELLCLG